mmetsp:Transcript_95681/g.298931  ORF Transcript_95681/g.298931 Transcript_95681/m.298931 type:complete len:334 (+) Transcript_95681:90-1091(+)
MQSDLRGTARWGQAGRNRPTAIPQHGCISRGARWRRSAVLAWSCGPWAARAEEAHRDLAAGARRGGAHFASVGQPTTGAACSARQMPRRPPPAEKLHGKVTGAGAHRWRRRACRVLETAASTVSTASTQRRSRRPTSCTAGVGTAPAGRTSPRSRRAPRTTSCTASPAPADATNWRRCRAPTTTRSCTAAAAPTGRTSWKSRRAARAPASCTARPGLAGRASLRSRRARATTSGPASATPAGRTRRRAWAPRATTRTGTTRQTAPRAATGRRDRGGWTCCSASRPPCERKREPLQPVRPTTGWQQDWRLSKATSTRSQNLKKLARLPDSQCKN